MTASPEVRTHIIRTLLEDHPVLSKEIKAVGWMGQGGSLLKRVAARSLVFGFLLRSDPGAHAQAEDYYDTIFEVLTAERLL